jgi:DNA-binding response OmpR family regulator
MEIRALVSKPCVLIIDPSAENREVLRTALMRQGTEVVEAARTDDGLRLAQSRQPDVIVVDVECETAKAESIAEDFRGISTGQAPSMVVLGTPRQARQVIISGRMPADEFVRKPYHYAPLIHKIEQLLAEHDELKVRRAA